MGQPSLQGLADRFCIRLGRPDGIFMEHSWRLIVHLQCNRDTLFIATEITLALGHHVMVY